MVTEKQIFVMLVDGEYSGHYNHNEGELPLSDDLENAQIYTGSIASIVSAFVNRYGYSKEQLEVKTMMIQSNKFKKTTLSIEEYLKSAEKQKADATAQRLATREKNKALGITPKKRGIKKKRIRKIAA